MPKKTDEKKKTTNRVPRPGSRGCIGILTGGGDVPGLNPAIRAITIRAARENFKVIGIHRGWAGLININRQKGADNSRCYSELTEKIVKRIGRTGGTFLHSSRTNPAQIPREAVPEILNGKYKDEINDLTPEVLKNLEFLGIDYLIPIGGDDTLSYAVRLDQEGIKVIGIPKTMDNDVPGTDYCIGFSTCITRIIEMTHDLRTTAGSHERFLIIEVFGRYAGFTALIPTMAGAASRCVIPEYKFDIEKLTELLVTDRENNSSHYSVCIVSEGAMFKGGDMIFKENAMDQFGHKKLGGIGEIISHQVKELSAKYSKRKINVISQRLGYLVRCGNPDAIDSIVPMAFGNLAMNLITEGTSGRLVNLRNGRYDNVPISVVTSFKKVVDVRKYYNTKRLRPFYKSFDSKPLFLMTSDF